MPWMTLFLIGLICAVHAFVSLFKDPTDIWASYGIVPGKYHTYLTYGLIHVDLKHLLTNMLTLLIFGIVVELQIGRLLFTSVVLIAIFAGAVCAVAFLYPTPIELSGRIVGFSVAVSALAVMGVSILISHWSLGEGLFWFALVLLALMGIYETWSVTSGDVSPAIGGSVLALVGLGAVLLCLSWFCLRTALAVVIPVLTMLSPLTGLLHAHGVHPGEVAHLAGAVVGAAFLYPILQNGDATDRTISAMGAVERCRSAAVRVVVAVRRN